MGIQNPVIVAGEDSNSSTHVPAMRTDGVLYVWNLNGGGGGGGTFTAGITTLGNTLGLATTVTNQLILVGGNNITLSATTDLNGISVTMIGPSNFSANGTTGSVSLVGGGAVNVAGAAGTISITAPNATNFSTISGTVVGNNLGALSTTFSIGNSLSLSGGGIVSIGGSGGTISISATTPSVTNFSTISLSGIGNTTVSASGTLNNVLSVSGDGIVSVGISNNNLTISATTPSVTNFSTVSMTALGNTTISSAGTFNNLLQFSGAGNVSVGVSNGTVTISGSGGGAGGGTPFQISGNTFGTSSLITSGTLYLQAVSNIYLSQSTTVGANSSTSNVISIGGPAYSAGAGLGVSTTGGSVSYALTSVITNYSTVSLSGVGNTTNSSSGTFNNILSVSGAGIVSVGISNNNLTISATTPSPSAIAGTQSISAAGTSVTGTAVSLALAAGSNVSLQTATGAGSMSVTVNATGPNQSLLQNYPLQQIGLLSSVTGTINGTAGFGSSLFLQRMFIHGTVKLTEVDMAIGLAFNATSNGAGSAFRTFGIYSFGNSTSLASVLSFSGSSSWTTGTVTAGASTSLTQFQGGWTGYNLFPVTFGSSSLSAGEYVVANLIDFSQGSSTWTASLMGACDAQFSTMSVVTGIGSTTAAVLSNAGTAGVSVISNVGTAGISAISNAGTAAAILAIATLSTTSFSATSQISSLASRTVFTAAPTAVNRTVFSVAPTQAAVTDFTVSPTSITALSSLSALTATLGYLATSTLIGYGYIGTGSTTSNNPTWFSAGVMSTGSLPTSIAVTNAAVSYSGSTAQIQPWFALIGQ